MMQSKVQEFHEAFGLPIDSIPTIDGRELTWEETCAIQLRRELIREEYEELMDAPYLEEVMKEACDLVYVVLGMFVAFGWSFEEAFDRIHKSNMTKLDDQGDPIFRDDGKILKGPNYVPPDLGDLV